MALEDKDKEKKSGNTFDINDINSKIFPDILKMPEPYHFVKRILLMDGDWNIYVYTNSNYNSQVTGGHFITIPSFLNYLLKKRAKQESYPADNDINIQNFDKIDILKAGNVKVFKSSDLKNMNILDNSITNERLQKLKTLYVGKIPKVVSTLPKKSVNQNFKRFIKKKKVEKNNIDDEDEVGLFSVVEDEYSNQNSIKEKKSSSDDDTQESEMISDNFMIANEQINEPKEEFIVDIFKFFDNDNELHSKFKSNIKFYFMNIHRMSKETFERTIENLNKAFDDQSHIILDDIKKFYYE